MLVDGSFTSILDPVTVDCNGGEACLLDTNYWDLKTREERLDYFWRLRHFATFVAAHPEVKSTVPLVFRSLCGTDPLLATCNCIWFPLAECARFFLLDEYKAGLALATDKATKDHLGDAVWVASMLMPMRKRMATGIAVCNAVLDALVKWGQDRTSADVIQHVADRHDTFVQQRAALRYLAIWFVIKEGYDKKESLTLSSLWGAMVECKRSLPLAAQAPLTALDSRPPELVAVQHYVGEQGKLKEYGCAIGVAKYYHRMRDELKLRRIPNSTVLQEWEQLNRDVYKQPEPADTPAGGVFDWQWFTSHVQPSVIFSAGTVPKDLPVIWTLRRTAQSATTTTA